MIILHVTIHQQMWNNTYNSGCKKHIMKGKSCVIRSKGFQDMYSMLTNIIFQVFNGHKLGQDG